MPRDAVSRTANVGTCLRKRNGGQKWVNSLPCMGRNCRMPPHFTYLKIIVQFACKKYEYLLITYKNKAKIINTCFIVLDNQPFEIKSDRFL